MSARRFCTGCNQPLTINTSSMMEFNEHGEPAGRMEVVLISQCDDCGIVIIEGDTGPISMPLYELSPDVPMLE